MITPSSITSTGSGQCMLVCDPDKLGFYSVFKKGDRGIIACNISQFVVPSSYLQHTVSACWSTILPSLLVMGALRSGGKTSNSQRMV